MSQRIKQKIQTAAKRGLWLLAAALSLSLPVFFGAGRGAQQGRVKPEETLPSPDRFAMEEGGRLFGRYCAACHGVSGRGDGRFYASSLEPAPADLGETSFQKSHTDRQLFRVISEGSAAVGKSDLCPGWGKTFSATDIGYLVAHIRQLQVRVESAPADAFR